MATLPTGNLDFEEQRVRILRAIEEIEKLAAESRKLAAEEIKFSSERLKLDAEQLKFDAERSKLAKDKDIAPWLLLAQGLIAGAALLGAGLGLAKYLIG
jgi:hypothetical protein